VALHDSLQAPRLAPRRDDDDDDDIDIDDNNALSRVVLRRPVRVDARVVRI
jgi:hypothetical protein